MKFKTFTGKTPLASCMSLILHPLPCRVYLVLPCQSVWVDAYTDDTNKFSPIDRFPFSITMDLPLWRKVNFHLNYFVVWNKTLIDICVWNAFCRFWLVTMIKIPVWTTISLLLSPLALFDLSLWSLQQMISAWEWQSSSVDVMQFVPLTVNPERNISPVFNSFNRGSQRNWPG